MNIIHFFLIVGIIGIIAFAGTELYLRHQKKGE